MKQIIKNYSLNATSKTVTLSDFTTVRLDRLQAIIDTTQNKFLYNLVDPTVASATVSTNVITLSTVNGAVNGDALEIVYDAAAGDPVYDLPVVAGNVASGAADSGNPVKVGGIYNSSAPTLTNGQRGDLQLDSSGSLNVSIKSGGGSSGTQYPELTTTAPATGTAMLGRYLATPSGNLTDGQMSMPLMDAYGQLKVVPEGTASQNLAQVNGATLSLGQTTMANSLPVTLASNQTILTTALSDFTNTANVVSPGTSPNGTNALLTAGTGYSTATVTLNAGTQNTTWYDMLLYAYLSVEILTNTGSSSLSFQTTGDSSFTNASAMPLTTSNGSPTTATSSATSTYSGPRQGRYFRISSNISGGNTATLVITFFTTGTSPNSLSVNTSSATGSAVPSNAFYMGINNGGNLAAPLTSADSGDAISTTSNALLFRTVAEGYTFNGTSWDRQRSATSASGTTGTGLLGTGVLGQYNSSAPTVTSGNYNTLQLDNNANLKVNIAATSGGGLGTQASSASPTNATWTTGTAVNTTLANTSTSGYSTATVTTVETGTTTTAGALTFEVYDGSNWWAVTGQQIGSYTVQSTYALVNNTNVAWQFDIAGFQGFRVRLSTAITGTGSPQVVVIVQLQSSPNDTTPTVGWAQQLDATNDAISAYVKAATYTKMTASGAVVAGTCVYYGWTCESASSGTIIVYDNTAASGNTIGGASAVTVVAGTMNMFPVPITMTTGLYVTIGGTATINFLTRSVSK